VIDMLSIEQCRTYIFVAILRRELSAALIICKRQALKMHPNNMK
jgi:hypothetical protein